MDQTQFSKTPPESKYFVYVLQSLKDKTYYIGYTQNLIQRLKAHNAGKSTYTKAHRPYHCVYYETYFTKQKAKQREKYLKRYANIKKFLKTRVPLTKSQNSDF